MKSEFWVVLIFLAFILMFYAPFIIHNKFKNKKLEVSKTYQMNKLNSLPDFSGVFKHGLVVRVETGITFFHNLIEPSGVLVKSFDPDWEKDDIDFFANKHGYSLKYIDF